MNGLTRIGIVTVIGIGVSWAGAASNILTPKEIMGKLNKGPNALTPTLKRGLQKTPPDWGDIQDEAKEYANLTATLAKTEAPRGDKDSWAKLTKEYADLGKSLADAAEKKDKNAALAAHGKISRICTACHKAHRAD
jgi:hypothetical protein